MPFYLADVNTRERISDKDFETPEDAMEYAQSSVFHTQALIMWVDNNPNV